MKSDWVAALYWDHEAIATMFASFHPDAWCEVEEAESLNAV